MEPGNFGTGRGTSRTGSAGANCGRHLAIGAAGLLAVVGMAMAGFLLMEQGRRIAALEDAFARQSRIVTELERTDSQPANSRATAADGYQKAGGARLRTASGFQHAVLAQPSQAVPRGPATAGTLAAASGGDAAAIADIATDVQALAAYMRGMGDSLARIEAELTAVEEKVAAIGPSSMEALEQATMEALGTIDQRLQLMSGRLDLLDNADQTAAKALEATRVALHAELAQWRDRQITPLWELTGQLAGTTIHFAAGTDLANERAAENGIKRVANLVLSSNAEIGVRVVGYTDFDTDDEAANRVMSQKRADEIRDQLISRGVPPGRVTAVGRSTEKRLTSSDAFANANRRVAFEPFILAGEAGERADE
jgi:outer membrane protein OmpA-like peptidoglycan-associated protein